MLRGLLEGVRWLRLGGAELAVATKSAVTRARVRLGAAPVRVLFERLARPFATPGAPGAWYRGCRLVSLDGTTLDLPDAPELEARYGRPGASRGTSSYPQLQLLSLTECGTHAIFAVALDRYDASELRLAPALLAQLRPEMLCLADRAFVGFELWREAAASGANLLWRLRANQVLPCRQRLADGSYLSQLYASPAHRRRDEDGLMVRVIEYRLEGRPPLCQTSCRVFRIAERGGVDIKQWLDMDKHSGTASSRGCCRRRAQPSTWSRARSVSASPRWSVGEPGHWRHRAR